MRCSIKPSNLAGLLANQLGDIEADIEDRIQEEVDKIELSFSNQCPDPAILAKITDVRNLLLNSCLLYTSPSPRDS